jgi:hypothetical protein
MDPGMNVKVPLRLYSVFHKPAFVPKADFIVPIQVGAALSTEQLPMLRDNAGDHISLWNRNFSELTACYWIWKNTERTEEAWGLCHYRRYFMQDKYKLLFKKRSRYYYPFTQSKLDKVVNDALATTLQKMLQQYDAIVQRPTYAHKEGNRLYTIEEAYAKAHDRSDWTVTIQVLLEKYPKYAESLDVFINQKQMSYYNMMVASWKVWDDYLAWVFDILFEVRNRITISSDPYQARIFGFLSERLLNLYLLHNQLRVGHLTIALFER